MTVQKWNIDSLRNLLLWRIFFSAKKQINKCFWLHAEIILFRRRFDGVPLGSRRRSFFQSAHGGITEREHWDYEKSWDKCIHLSTASWPRPARNSATMAWTSAVSSSCDFLFFPDNFLEDESFWGPDNFATISAILKDKSSVRRQKKKKKRERSHIASVCGSSSESCAMITSFSSPSFLVSRLGGGEISLGTSLLRGEDMSTFVFSKISVEFYFLYTILYAFSSS